LPKYSPFILSIVLMLVSGITVAVMQALARDMSSGMHPFEIVFFRTFIAVIIMAPLAIKSGTKVFKTSSPKLQILRALIGSSGMLCFFYGLSLTTLAEATTLGFLVPIFATLLAIIFLKERVKLPRWAAIGVSFTGALIVIRPDISLSLGPLLILYASLSWAISILIAKKLTIKDSPISITFWQAVGGAPLALIVSIPIWMWPNTTQWSLLIIIACLGTIAQTSLNAALKLGDVSFLLPLDYLRLIWAILLGYAFFGDIPGLGLFIGGTLIIGATSFLTYRESLSKNKLAATDKIPSILS
jgi:drug/metabolite transporter (DMT)-like permease